jgi:Fe-coproporphyrin III synthase
LAHRATNLPNHVTVFVNWACNLRCRECWLYGDSADENLWLEGVMKDTLPFELFQQLIEELLAAEPRTSISLMGGEPYLHKDLSRMVDFLKSRSPESYIDVSTNGTLARRRGEEILAAEISQVYFSLDGSRPEINDPIRGEGCFTKTVDGIRYYLSLRDRYPRTRISLNFTITSLNYRDLVEMVNLAESLGIDELSVNFAMFFSQVEGASTAKRFSPILGREFFSWKGFQNDAMAQGADALALRETLEEAHAQARTVRLLVAPLRYSFSERSRYFDPEWRSVVKETSCPRLNFQTTLLPNGDVISCTPFSDTVMGNLNQTSLRGIWHGERYEGMRRALGGGLAAICYRCCDLNNDMDLDPRLFTSAR